MQWAPAHVFPIIVHSNMSIISIIREVLRSFPTDFSCHYNSLYAWGITFERASLFKAKTTFRVYYQMYGNHLLSNKVTYTWWITFNAALIWT